MQLNRFYRADAGDDMGFHPEAQQKAYQRRGEIAATGTADKARIIIKGEQSRQAVLAEKLGNHLQQGFGIEISSDLPMQPDRGACIRQPLAISTTCCRFPCGSAGTLLASFRSSWTSAPGCRGSIGLGLCRRSGTIQPAWRRIFQIGVWERGKRTSAWFSDGSWCN